MIEKCDWRSRATMAPSTARSSPVVRAAAARGRSVSRTARQSTPLNVVSQCVRAMIVHALSNTAAGSDTGVASRDPALAPSPAAPHAAGSGGSEATARGADAGPAAARGRQPAAATRVAAASRSTSGRARRRSGAAVAGIPET
jgi:hypothetical protein